MDILYQDKIINYIDNCTLDTFPHTVLIQGDKGGGKHLICNYISKKFGYDLIDITDKLTLETITEIYLSNQINFYLIDSDNISIKEQNVILKFLEEPCINAFILIINSYNQLLNTIKNRCFKLSLNRYTKEQLQTFINQSTNPLILQISTTPGQITEYINSDFDGMQEFANKIFEHIKTANISNCLTIPNKIFFSKEEPDKYDINLFCMILLYQSKFDYKVYNLTNQLVNNLYIPHVNKKNLFEKYLVDLKLLLKSYEIRTT